MDESRDPGTQPAPTPEAHCPRGGGSLRYRLFSGPGAGSPQIPHELPTLSGSGKKSLSGTNRPYPPTEALRPLLIGRE